MLRPDGRRCPSLQKIKTSRTVLAAKDGSFAIACEVVKATLLREWY